MGMYSELVLGVQLKPTTPKEVIEILEYLCIRDDRYSNRDNFEIFDHPFFKSEKAESIFAYEQNSFDSIPGSSMTYQEYWKGYVLTVRAHLKNYDFEYEKFLDWISPYCQTGENHLEYIGYIHYEDWFTPNLIFINTGQIWMAEVTIPSNVNGRINVSDADDEYVVPNGLPDQLRIRGFITLKDHLESFYR